MWYGEDDEREIAGGMDARSMSTNFAVSKGHIPVVAEANEGETPVDDPDPDAAAFTITDCKEIE